MDLPVKKIGDVKNLALCNYQSPNSCPTASRDRPGNPGPTMILSKVGRCSATSVKIKPTNGDFEIPGGVRGVNIPATYKKIL